MNSQIETIVQPAGAHPRRPRLVRAAYVAAVAIAMIGWLITLSRAAVSLLMPLF